MTESGPQVFGEVLQLAERRLWADWQEAQSLQHRPLRGSAREDAVRDFLGKQLPHRFRVVRGEAIDRQGHRSGELDLVVYDSLKTRPLVEHDSGTLLPAEALLATIEVKSIVNLAAVRATLEAANKIHALRPYNEVFQTARGGGEHADDGKPRVFTTLFGFRSDLAEAAWGESEHRRISESGVAVDCALARLDRVLVLDRGLVLPAGGQALRRNDQGQGLLQQWFFHLVNFLSREAERRQPFQWTLYGARTEEDGTESVRSYSRDPQGPSADLPRMNPARRRARPREGLPKQARRLQRVAGDRGSEAAEAISGRPPYGPKGGQNPSRPS